MMSFIYNKGIELVFLKEPHINTATYKKALQNNVSLTGTNVDCILEGVNKYLMALAKEQIKLAFEQSENKKYYVQIRTYKKAGGKNYYSSWSSAKSVKTKK